MSLFKALLTLHVCMAALSPVWAQSAFDDADAQLQVRQAATAASEAARKVAALRTHRGAHPAEPRYSRTGSAKLE